jgi:hypothetical protein
MRPAVIIVLAVLIAALLAYDTYEYDGYYRNSAWEQAKQQTEKLHHEVESLLGNQDQ